MAPTFNMNILLAFHTSAGRKADNRWLNCLGLVLFGYLSTLGTMLSFYKHTASLYPSPSKRETLPPIQLSNIMKESPGEELLGKYSYNSQHSDTGYIKLFEIYITSSYVELGRPPREQTIEGQEARNYTYSLQQTYFGIHKLEKTIHGNLPCIMLANSIRGEDDHQIKAEIIHRLETAKQQTAIEQFDVVWVTVNSPSLNTKTAAKCIMIPKDSQAQIPHVIDAINTSKNKTEYPHTYNYYATALILPTQAIEHAINLQAKFTRSLTSVSITGLNKIDIYNTIPTTTTEETSNATKTKTIVQLILNGSYTTPEGYQLKSPVTKISMSENKGRYNLFTNKNNAQSLIDYTMHLLTILPTWLVRNKNYTGGKILADNTAAAQYAQTQPQIQPNSTKPKQAEQTATPPQHKTPDLYSVKSLTPVINQLKNQLST
jgi:hypothetical protein